MRATCVMLAAVLILACRAQEKAPDIPALMEDLKSADQDKKGRAALALIVIGEAAVPPLAEMLKSPVAAHRASAVSTLFGIGPAARGAVPALGEALADPDPDVRSGAAMALENIGPDSAGAVPSLIRALKDREFVVRQRAAKALGSIGPAAQDAVPALAEAAKGDPAAEEAIRKIRAR